MIDRVDVTALIVVVKCDEFPVSACSRWRGTTGDAGASRREQVQHAILITTV